MKHLMILTAGICLLMVSLPVMADQAEDEASIRKLRARAIKAWNTKDLDTIEDIYAEDAWVAEGMKVSELLKAVPALYEGEWKEFHIEQLKEIDITFVTPNVAIFMSRQVYSGVFDKQGNLLPSTEVLYKEVFVKRDGKWRGYHWDWRPIEGDPSTQ